MNALRWGIAAVENGWVADSITRRGIRQLCRQRLDQESEQAKDSQFVASLRNGPIALVPHRANQQHYEVPASFFTSVLGPRLKYSCCYWPDDGATLAEAEEEALRVTCQRAQLANGQRILELGCGWGSLSLWMAEQYPASQIVAVSNSASQKAWIDATAQKKSLANLQVVTADMNDFAPPAEPNGAGFDRVVSVEMFEHMRNYDQLLQRIRSWLAPQGLFFGHLFCHDRLAYPFDSAGEVNWMGKHFFSGGIMPSSDMLRQFDRHLRVAQQWRWNGDHYRRTAEAWLRNLDQHRDQALAALAASGSRESPRRLYHRWRIFFLAVAELFGYGNGEQWFVCHYLLEPALATSKG